MTERPDLLTNPRSDRVAMVKRLSGRSARRRHGQFLVEGPQGAREAVRHAADRVRDLYLTSESAERHPEILRDARGAGVRVHLATAEVLAAMSPDAQGVLAVARIVQPRLPDRDLRLMAVLPWAADPGNLGTVIRAADAAGADAVVLGPGSVEVHNPKVVRATAGSLFHLPVIAAGDLAAAVTDLRARGVQILAATPDAPWTLPTPTPLSVPTPLATPTPLSAESAVFDVRNPAVGGGGTSAVTAHPRRPPADGGVAPDLGRPTAWLFGNEAHGLRDAELELADAVVGVPIYGLAESLNLATAAALCLYASAWAQRRVDPDRATSP